LRTLAICLRSKTRMNNSFQPTDFPQNRRGFNALLQVV
jgi:hypothetical protein